MKILIPESGKDNLFRGISISTQNIVANLPKEYEVTYYKYGIPTISGNNAYLSTYIYEQTQLCDALDEVKADLSWFTKNNGICLQHGGRKVSTIYDVIAVDRPDLQGGAPSPYRDLLRLSRLAGALHSNLIIVPSLYTKERLMKLFDAPENKIRVIPLAADKSIFNTVPVNKISLQAFEHILPKNYILSVGAYNTHKNFGMLIKAYAKSNAIKNDMKLVLVGPSADFTKGNLLNNLQELVKSLELSDHVVFLTDYNHTNGIDVIYKKASFFVNVSLYEGFGMPLIEAMSCGKAVISSVVTSQGEVVGEAALKVDPLDINDITTSINTLLKSSSIVKQLEGKSLKRSMLFDWGDIGLQHARVFDECLK